MDDYKKEIIELVRDRPLLWDPQNPECCDVVLWPMEGEVLACGTARADKSCVVCRVPSMEGPPNM